MNRNPLRQAVFCRSYHWLSNFAIVGGNIFEVGTGRFSVLVYLLPATSSYVLKDDHFKLLDDGAVGYW